MNNTVNIVNTVQCHIWKLSSDQEEKIFFFTLYTFWICFFILYLYEMTDAHVLW